MADFAVSPLRGQDLLALEGVFCLLADPGVEALGVHELHTTCASTWGDALVVGLLGTKADTALREGVLGLGCADRYMTGLKIDHSCLHFSIMRRV